MLRPESKARARAVQLLYAWEVQARPSIELVADRLTKAHRAQGRAWDHAQALASAVAHRVDELDREIAEAAEHWRLPRMGLVERNILRLSVHELLTTDTPAPVVISEALRLTRWFGGSKAPPFVNGVLDALARKHGRL
jgi:N utilization substance protein B